MQRIITTGEKNISAQPPAPVVVPANTSTQVLADDTKSFGENAGRFIQNVGANDAYFAIGQECDNLKNYHGILQAGGKQQLDASQYAQSVNCFSVGGTTIAVMILRRNDLTQSPNVL